jgi:hypothetical protein
MKTNKIKRKGKRMFKQTLLLFVILSSACIEFGEEGSCAEYVDYMCTCHADDPNYNCSELKNLYETVDSATMEQCALDLDDQIYEDTQEGYSCDVNSDTGADSGI